MFSLDAAHLGAAAEWDAITSITLSKYHHLFLKQSQSSQFWLNDKTLKCNLFISQSVKLFKKHNRRLLNFKSDKPDFCVIFRDQSLLKVYELIGMNVVIGTVNPLILGLL